MLDHCHFLLHPLQFIIHSVLNSLELQTVLLSKLWIICLSVEGLKLFHLNEVRYPFFFVGREVLVVTGITKMTSYGFLVSVFDLRYLTLISSTRCPCPSKCNLTAKRENTGLHRCTHGHLKMKRSLAICLHWDLQARWYRLSLLYSNKGQCWNSSLNALSLQLHFDCGSLFDLFEILLTVICGKHSRFVFHVITDYFT